jgi:hypothetical protein
MLVTGAKTSTFGIRAKLLHNCLRMRVEIVVVEALLNLASLRQVFRPGLVWH